MKKSIVIFVVLAGLLRGGTLLANPDPTNIIGEAGDQVIGTIAQSSASEVGEERIITKNSPNTANASHLNLMETGPGEMISSEMVPHEISAFLPEFDSYYGEKILYFSQFISGGGSGTEFILVNNCSESKTGSIVYYSNSNFSLEGDVIRVEPYTIPAGDVSVHQWYDSGGLVVGGVEITQTGDTECKIEGTEFFNALGTYTTVGYSEFRGPLTGDRGLFDLQGRLTGDRGLFHYLLPISLNSSASYPPGGKC